MIPNHLQHFTSPVRVLDDGFVRLVNIMGDDGSVVEAARVTTGKGRSVHEWSKEVEGASGLPDHGAQCKVCTIPAFSGISDHCLEGDRRLIRYMLRHAHWSPFEFAEIAIHLRLPMDVWRQLVRHWSLSVQEYSTRYSEAIDSMATTAPDAWRAQSGASRQGSAGMVVAWPAGFVEEQVRTIAEFSSVFSGGEPDALALSSAEAVMGTLTPGAWLTQREAEVQGAIRDMYQERLRFGVAKEQARKDLPLSNYTEVYLKGNLRDWLNMLGQRLDEHAQWEIRQYAQAIAEIVKLWCPLAWEAFVDYRLNAHTFSGSEMAILWNFFACAKPGEVLDVDTLLCMLDGADKPRMSDRERTAFLKALGLDGAPPCTHVQPSGPTIAGRFIHLTVGDTENPEKTQPLTIDEVLRHTVAGITRRYDLDSLDDSSKAGIRSWIAHSIDGRHDVTAHVKRVGVVAALVGAGVDPVVAEKIAALAPL